MLIGWLSSMSMTMFSMLLWLCLLPNLGVERVLALTLALIISALVGALTYLLMLCKELSKKVRALEDGV